jgi:hypothetical protein
MLNSIKVFGLFLLIGMQSIYAQMNSFGDCINALKPCSKAFRIETLYSYGNINENLGDNKCFTGDNIEKNSVWIKLKITKSGNLAFDITPLDNQDDIDFIVYKNPKSCDQLKAIRCMASGENLGTVYNNSQRCMGMTGLRNSSKDDWEKQGCFGNADNYLSTVSVGEKDEIIIFINNYTSSKGFDFRFTGNCEFESFKPGKMSYIGELKGQKLLYSFFHDDVANPGASEVNWIIVDNGNEIQKSGTRLDNIEFSQSGLKTIIRNITNILGCQFSDTISLYLRSIDPNTAPSDFYVSEIYPNPANSMINFELFNNKTANIEILVYNQEGKEVIKRSKEELNKYKLMTLPVSNLTPGQYILTVREKIKNGKLASKKFTIAK